MLGSKIDLKNVQLALLLSNLRQNLDLHRVIGLNADELKKLGLGESFWGAVQQSAHDEIVLLLCKIYEREDQYERNSIPGVINALPSSKYTETQRASVVRFGKKYGNTAPSVCLKCHLQDTLRLFVEANADTFNRIRKFRNKFGAHSEHGAKPTSLPSHKSFETLFDFGVDFYKMISDGILGVGPALMGGYVGVGTIKLMKKLGIEKPQFSFTN